MKATNFHVDMISTVMALSLFFIISFCTPLGRAQDTVTQMSYEEAMIRWTYLKLTYYNSIANREKARVSSRIYNPQEDISFDIQNVHTGPINEIYNKKIDGLMSDPSGSIVSLSITTHTQNNDKSAWVSCSAEWTQGQYATTVAPQNINMSDLLPMLGEQYTDVGKYSAYEVTVKLSGKARKYKAIVIYHNPFQSLENQRPEFWDTVVGLGGVITDVWKETRPPLGSTKKDILKLYGNESSSPKLLKPYGCDSNQALCCNWGAKSLSECKWSTDYPWNEPKDNTIPQSNIRDSEQANGILFNRKNNAIQATDLTLACNYQDQIIRLSSMNGPRGRENHDSGSHNAFTEVDFRCKMTNTCVATCEPILSQNGTSENAEGVTWFLDLYQPYHVPRKLPALENGSTSGAGTTNVSCKGGSGYAFKSCIFSGCTVDLTVSWSGFTLTANSSDLWSTAHSRNHTCYFSDTTAGGGGSGGPPTCGTGTGLYCYQGNSFCLPYTFPTGNCCCSMSPIVIDISRYWDWATNSGNGYHFTDVANGVMFDLNGDGVKEQVAWPTATSENAWLALDRNGNGVIDDGKELFGNFTDQEGPSGQLIPVGQGNGWLALAELDRVRSGGNENGMVDKDDAWFPNLRLWVDRNHNGISEPNELLTLASIGLTGIELTYDSLSGWTDQFGNSFKIRSRFRWGDRDDPESFYTEWFKDAWDVFPLWTP